MGDVNGEPCDACVGRGVDLRGEVCGCGGSGKLADMATYLRQLLYDAGTRVKDAESALWRIKAHVDGELSGPGPRIGATGASDVERGMLMRTIRVIDDAVEKHRAKHGPTPDPATEGGENG